VTQARAEAWRALSSDSAEALFVGGGWLVGGEEEGSVRVGGGGEIFIREGVEEVDNDRELKDDFDCDREKTLEKLQVFPLGAFVCFDFSR
jgi:hypothetical protein